jgi:hypothetical protein
LPHQHNRHARKQGLKGLSRLLTLHLRIQDVLFHYRDRKRYALLFDDRTLDFNHWEASAIRH